MERHQSPFQKYKAASHTIEICRASNSFRQSNATYHSTSGVFTRYATHCQRLGCSTFPTMTIKENFIVDFVYPTAVNRSHGFRCRRNGSRLLTSAAGPGRI